MGRSPLLQEQEELLAVMVEAMRSVPRNQRHPFLILEYDQGTLLSHSGLPAIGKESYQTYIDDARELASRGFIHLEAMDYHSYRADVTTDGLHPYELTKTSKGEPIQRVVENARVYVLADEFRRGHPTSTAKWEQTEAALWSTDSGSQLTTIGHLCREAMQAFATESLARISQAAADPDAQRTINRLRAAFNAKVDSPTVRRLGDALITYWAAVNELVQRQEHGAQKEGDPLLWEDARRVVFQTLFVMYEVDRALR